MSEIKKIRNLIEWLIIASEWRCVECESKKHQAKLTDCCFFNKLLELQDLGFYIDWSVRCGHK